MEISPETIEKIKRMKGLAWDIRVVVTDKGITTVEDRSAAIEDLKTIQELGEEVLQSLGAL